MKKDITNKEKYGKAVEILNEEEAKQYFEECVAHYMENTGSSREEAENVERENIGYYAGYYGTEEMARVKKLYSAKHPVFDKSNSSTEAFLRGFNRGVTEK